ncbi:MAG: hypothetical protein ACLU48_11655 [Clostridiaceae bacterium]
MEKTEAEKILKEKLETAEKILVGIGSEWKKRRHGGGRGPSCRRKVKKFSGWKKIIIS